MLQLPTVLSLIAIIFAAWGEWMIGTWIANQRRSSRKKVAHWSAGALLVACAAALLAMTVGMLLNSGSHPSPAFWVGIGLVLELPIVIAFVVTWPSAVNWGMKRETLNPPVPFLATGMVGALVATGVFLAGLVVANL
ncbi:MAG TPA: hypothetical protein VL294_12555 [Pseudolysinimonas sp.]|jgi:hypothetical protein|nr:hypothetical protein [Pseudolysinimonas sp.]